MATTVVDGARRGHVALPGGPRRLRGPSRRGCWPPSWAWASSPPRRPRTSSARATGCSALLLFVLGNIGVTASIVFYESLLPHIASEDELDRVSSAGYALGYLGGGLLDGRERARDPRGPTCSASPDAGGHPPVLPVSRPSGGRRSRSRCSAASPSRPRRRAGRASRPGPREDRARPPAARPCASMRLLQADVPVPGRLPHLQRRHRHHHPHGLRSTAPRWASTRSS